MTITAKDLVNREILLGKGSELRRAADIACPETILDRASKLSPGWYASRQQGRMERTIMAGGYDVTRPGRTRRMRSNRTADGGADNAIDDRTLWELRELCRNHDRNNPLWHGLIERGADNITGPVFGFRPDSGDAKFDADAAEALKSRCETAEYRGLFNLQEMLHTAVRSLAPDGDLLFNFLQDGAIQPVEAHDLVTPAGGVGWRGRRVVGGVEIDEAGRHAAYLVRDPRQKSKYQQNWTDSHETAQRLPAENVEHIANRHRFSQTRGVPTLASCLEMFDSLDGYLDSEMLAAQIDSHIVRAITREGSDLLPGTEFQTDPNSTTSSASSFDKLLRSEPGQILDLLLGEDIKSVGGNRPGQQFEPYTVTVLRFIGAAVGFPLELVLLDFSKTNYSSARAALLQAYRVFQRWQNYTRDRIITPTYRRWMTKWIASGDLAAVPNAFRLQFFPPRWAWIDPLKEVLALEKEIAAGARTLTEWIGETGRVAESIFETRGKELALLREQNVPTTTAPENLGAKPQANEANRKNDAETLMDKQREQEEMEENRNA